MSGAQGEGVPAGRSTGSIGATQMFRDWIAVMVAPHCEGTKCCLIVHYTTVKFVLCKLRLNIKMQKRGKNGSKHPSDKWKVLVRPLPGVPRTLTTCR